MVFRGDITRIGGTYWNLSGYWRGRLTKESAASQQTLQNLINRTYHLNMTYDNPNSDLVAGFGRLYLPWAPSLDTIDGGYFGKRTGAWLDGRNFRRIDARSVFLGLQSRPRDWRRIHQLRGRRVTMASALQQHLRELGVSMVNWAIDRPFIFFEDSVSYKRDSRSTNRRNSTARRVTRLRPRRARVWGAISSPFASTRIPGSNSISTTTISAIFRPSIPP